jgi:hypothetical protein
MFGNSSKPIDLSISFVSLSIRIVSNSIADFSGTKSKRLSRSSSCNFNEIPRTGPNNN